MNNLYRGPTIDASYQVSVHLAKGFQRGRLKCEKLTDDRRRTPSDGKSSHCLWQGELIIKRKMTNTDQQNTTQKTNDCKTWTSLKKTGVNSRILQQQVLFKYHWLNLISACILFNTIVSHVLFAIAIKKNKLLRCKNAHKGEHC